MALDEAGEVELILEVQRHETLYNREVICSEARRKAEWVLVGAALTVPISGEDAKIHWQRIVRSYRQNLARRKGRSGMGADEVPAAYLHAPILGFLERRKRPRGLSSEDQASTPSSECTESVEGDEVLLEQALSQPFLVEGEGGALQELRDEVGSPCSGYGDLPASPPTPPPAPPQPEPAPRPASRPVVVRFQQQRPRPVAVIPPPRVPQQGPPPRLPRPQAARVQGPVQLVRRDGRLSILLRQQDSREPWRHPGTLRPQQDSSAAGQQQDSREPWRHPGTLRPQQDSSAAGQQQDSREPWRHPGTLRPQQDSSAAGQQQDSREPWRHPGTLRPQQDSSAAGQQQDSREPWRHPGTLRPQQDSSAAGQQQDSREPWRHPGTLLLQLEGAPQPCTRMQLAPRTARKHWSGAGMYTAWSSSSNTRRTSWPTTWRHRQMVLLMLGLMASSPMLALVVLAVLVLAVLAVLVLAVAVLPVVVLAVAVLWARMRDPVGGRPTRSWMRCSRTLLLFVFCNYVGKFLLGFHFDHGKEWTGHQGN
ncbi:Filamentous hemagglutinin [Frankliniella fusca]|uniref:Filamentous hemagglutinin n=1 Tax=Frankliniella fusca TaxID=407009 RepID=A0AAE1I782_9NEOP|nr:Filamentous hemagglutinin [Frankliniella fusca]